MSVLLEVTTRCKEKYETVITLPQYFAYGDWSEGKE
jgi:hypothetical protein